MPKTTTEELNAVADTLSTVYRKRGYILVDDVQSKLDECGASLVETTQLTRLLEERGCRVSEHGDTEDDLSMYKRHALSLGGDLTYDDSYHGGCRFIIEMPK